MFTSMMLAKDSKSAFNGYEFRGHTGSTQVADVNKYDFSASTNTFISAAISTYFGASVNQNKQKAYLSGGYLSGDSTNCYSYGFSNQVGTFVGSKLAVVGREITGASSGTVGYSLGGTSRSNEIDAIVFATEAFVNTADSLNTAHDGVTPNAALSTSKGYIFGNGSAALTRITAFNFSTETDTDIAAVTGIARAKSAHWFSETKGYVGGGGNAATNTIDSLVFATEARAAVSATLPVSIRYAGASSSLTQGISYGGSNGSASTEIQGIDFTTESAINPAAALQNAVYITLGSQG